ncbi:MAG TPA: protein kinase [Gemmatimonadales bacterium]|nr:protein kinase [Gemmatimonadales bacterium]
MQTALPPSELMGRLQAALGTQYRLERELGHGGMGVVFLARDTTLDRSVAVKVVHPDLAIHTSITQRFLAEARMIARLRHPNIVAVHAAGEATGLFYYVMDYVPGESLRQRLSRGSLPLEEGTAILTDLADALDAAGAAGLVHRDVKPENILLDQATGRPMLADFGIGRVMEAETEGMRTDHGVAVGTPTYMSPEQAAGDAVDARSDLYALGVVGYEMLSGRPPFRGDNAAAVASKHLTERPAPLETLRPGVPPHVAHAIARALEKDPGHRWQTGAELRRALLGETPVPRRSRLRRSVISVLGIGLAALGLTFLLHGRDGPAPGMNPRHSILVMPFENVRQDPTVEWMRDGSVSMLALNLSQWTDLSVVDHERLHDLFERRHVASSSPPSLELARQLARDAGVWTVVLGDFERVGDTLHLVARLYDVASGKRLDVAEVRGRPGEDVRPLFDELAARLLDLAGAPSGVTTDLARATTGSLEAYRAYLQGIEELNAWNLRAAEASLRRSVAIDTTFALAYYKLSLTRGWIAGQFDSLGIAAVRRATQFADRLPAHEQAMIEAYRSFVEGDYAKGRAGYEALLKRDSTDADAWYGLGDVNFHDPMAKTQLNILIASLRAFKRALALDPDYYLAYEHLAFIYRQAAVDHPRLALLPGDSLAYTKDGGPRPGLDAATLTRAIERAREEGIAGARDWEAHQPDNAHAQNALVFALSAARRYDAALAEIDRLAHGPDGAGRADLPFLRAQVLTEQRDLKDAVQTVATALDTTRPAAFDPGRLTTDALGGVTNGANAAAYLGKVAVAERSLDLFAEVSALWNPTAPGSQRLGGRSLLGHLLRSHLYTALGAPASKLQPIWDAVADSARRAPKAARAGIVDFGWAAAVGLYLQNPADPGPLNELQALGGGTTPPELQALVALERGDSAEARRQLVQPDTQTAMAYEKRSQWWGYRSMIAANTWLALGDDSRALEALEPFEPDKLSSSGFDVRWMLAGQARILRGEIYEHEGKPQLAREQYEAALAQWGDADPVLDPLIGRVRARLAGLTGRG